jgi:hypothetical protein
MTLLQSLIPTNFAKQPSKKFERKHKQYLKNKRLATIARRADQLMIDQLAQKAKKQLSLSTIPTSNVDSIITSDPDLSNDSDDSDSSAHYKKSPIQY